MRGGLLPKDRKRWLQLYTGKMVFYKQKNRLVSSRVKFYF